MFHVNKYTHTVFIDWSKNPFCLTFPVAFVWFFVLHFQYDEEVVLCLLLRLIRLFRHRERRQKGVSYLLYQRWLVFLHVVLACVLLQHQAVVVVFQFVVLRQYVCFEILFQDDTCCMHVGACSNNRCTKRGRPESTIVKLSATIQHLYLVPQNWGRVLLFLS